MNSQPLVLVRNKVEQTTITKYKAKKLTRKKCFIFYHNAPLTISTPNYDHDRIPNMTDETYNQHCFRLSVYVERTHDDSVLPVSTETHWAGLFDADELEVEGMLTEEDKPRLYPNALHTTIRCPCAICLRGGHDHGLGVPPPPPAPAQATNTKELSVRIRNLPRRSMFVFKQMPKYVLRACTQSSAYWWPDGDVYLKVRIWIISICFRSRNLFTRVMLTSDIRSARRYTRSTNVFF